MGPRVVCGLTLALVLAGAMPAKAQGPLTHTCYFAIGPKAGQAQFFPSLPPGPIGGRCTDGMISAGFGVRDGDTNPRGTFDVVNSVPTCVDIIGTRVRYQLVPDNSIAKTGISFADAQGPYTFLRADQLKQMPKPMQKYMYAHECGHHALGHVLAFLRLGQAVFSIGREQEIAADCFAIVELRGQNLMTDQDVEVVLGILSTLPADAANYPGPVRVIRIRACANLN